MLFILQTFAISVTFYDDVKIWHRKEMERILNFNSIVWWNYSHLFDYQHFHRRKSSNGTSFILFPRYLHCKNCVFAGYMGTEIRVKTVKTKCIAFLDWKWVFLIVFAESYAIFYRLHWKLWSTSVNKKIPFVYFCLYWKKNILPNVSKIYSFNASIGKTTASFRQNPDQNTQRTLCCRGAVDSPERLFHWSSRIQFRKKNKIFNKTLAKNSSKQN